MAEYIAKRIIEGAQYYHYVVSKRPDLKEGIDAYLVANGRADLIITQ